MLLNSHISAHARCLAGKVCGLVRSTQGTSLGEDKLGARDKILNTKVARRACAGQTFPPHRRRGFPAPGLHWAAPPAFRLTPADGPPPASAPRPPAPSRYPPCAPLPARRYLRAVSHSGALAPLTAGVRSVAPRARPAPSSPAAAGSYPVAVGRRSSHAAVCAPWPRSVDNGMLVCSFTQRARRVLCVQRPQMGPFAPQPPPPPQREVLLAPVETPPLCTAPHGGGWGRGGGVCAVGEGLGREMAIHASLLTTEPPPGGAGGAAKRS